MSLKNIPVPGYSTDDGSADPELAAALAAYAQDRAEQPRVLAALRGARMLVPVVAVLGEVETGPDGLKREKTSDMAVPTLRAPDGRRALPAFTSMETLHRWRPDARPVAVPMQQALRAAAHEKADTLVIDLAGPVTFQLSGAALRALAEGRSVADPLADPAVVEAVRGVLSARPDVAGAHLVPSTDGTTDGTLAVVPASGGVAAEETVRGVARALAEDEVLRARLEGGLDLALLPPGSELPEDALLAR